MIRADRIKEERDRKGLSQTQLGELIGKSQWSVLRLEKGTREPKTDELQTLASVLGVSTDYLMGRTDDPAPAQDIKKEAHLHMQNEPQEAKVIINEHYGMGKTILLPVYDDLQSVCAGRGLETGECESLPIEFLPIPSWLIPQPISDEPGKAPFIVTVYGDSMTEAKLPNGIQVIVNPIAEINDGDVAIVSLNGERMIKWLYWDKDGGGEIRSSSTRYPVRYFTKEDLESGRFRIMGKVGKSLGDPERGA